MKLMRHKSNAVSEKFAFWKHKTKAVLQKNKFQVHEKSAGSWGVE